MSPRALDEAQQMARSYGMRLMEISSIYEVGVVPASADTAALAVVGLVARQRRLLKAIYVLTDASHELEAAVLMRTLLEYHIQQRWLLLDPERHVLHWVAEDLRIRLAIDREIKELSPESHRQAVELMTLEQRVEYERGIAEFEVRINEAARRLGHEKLPRYPTVQEQARAVGMSFSYSLAYRSDSQRATHPTAVAAEQLFADGTEGVSLLPSPAPERGYGSPYIFAAVVLRDSLLHASQHIAALRLAGLDDVSALIDACAAPDD